MLNPFPFLLSLSIFAPFILRLVVGYYFMNKGIKHLKLTRHTGEEIARTSNIFKDGHYLLWGGAVIEAVAGLALFVGFLTQIATLLLAMLLIAGKILKKKNLDIFTDNNELSTVLLAICLSLLLTGAGWPALDLPL